MSTSTILFGLFGVAAIIIDAFVWGVTGYVLFRLFGGRDSHWWIGATVLAVVFFVWDELFLKVIMHSYGFSVKDPGVTDLLGDSVTKIDIVDVILSVAASFGGFRVGQALFKRTLTKLKDKAG